ncbi:hypothetical protein ASV53_18965 [Photobacterium sanguinicancri]|uniref:Uncharacterized protein n=1 Tax=Photobacterium sanguinicancri TaxID=875932 RepID=A0ABX4FTY6_9GAMM|nr:hypothetical protein ASV53_18965 [Photobacterium sanguinicancri]
MKTSFQLTNDKSYKNNTLESMLKCTSQSIRMVDFNQLKNKKKTGLDLASFFCYFFMSRVT